MKTLPVKQGSDEWLAVRPNYRCASDAAAMAGLDPKMSRTELLRLKKTGDEKQISAWVRDNLFAKGHATEAMARAILEDEIDESFYPVTGVSDDNRYLASYDGLTIEDDIGFEHKQWNEELAASVSRGRIPPSHTPQLDHQFLVNNKLQKIIFVVSNGTREKWTAMEYLRNDDQVRALDRAWHQFDADLETFEHVEVIPAPAPRVMNRLPTLVVNVTGQVLASNLSAYREAALAMIGEVRTELETDQDFADAENAIKWFDGGEKELVAVKRLALAQTVSIAELFDTIDQIAGAMRAKRLALDKLVEERKKTIRADILAEGVIAYKKHIASLNARLGKPYMTNLPVDFAGAMKGKRTVASLRGAVADELARAKIAANEVADKIQMNLATLNTLAPGYLFLFADTPTLVLKAGDDLAALIENRIGAHKAEEERKAEAKRKADEAKAQQEAAERAERERAAAAAPPPVETAPPAAIEVPPRVAPAPDALVPPAAAAAPAVGLAAARPTGTPNVGMPAGIWVGKQAVRPTDDAIVRYIATGYNVPIRTVIDWLLQLDLGPIIEALPQDDQQRASKPTTGRQW